MYDVLCISDCCVDLVFQGLPRIPAPGAEEYGTDLLYKAGGGANTPMGLARLGCHTGYITSVGDDLFGDVVANEMARHGVGEAFMQRKPGARTWVSAVLSTPGERAFASYAGRDVELDDTLLAGALQGVKLVHTYIHYCRKFPQIAAACKQGGIALSVDTAFEPGTTLEDIAPVLREADIFLPNESEACELAGTKDVYEALRRLGAICPYTVITRGGKGCIALHGGKVYTANAAKAGPLVDVNGAGDMFNAGLLSAYVEGASVPQQLQRASASGSLATTWPGGVDDAYTKERVLALAGTVQVTEKAV